MVDEGNPPSTMNLSGPLQPGNDRVSFNSDGVIINEVSIEDDGIHNATWRNTVGEAMFILRLTVIPGKPIHVCI